MARGVARFALVVSLALPVAASAAGVMTYVPFRDHRYVQSYTKPSGGVSLDSAYAKPSTPLADFSTTVRSELSVLGVQAAATQSSYLNPTQLWANGTSLIDASSVAGYDSQAFASSRFNVGFTLTEPHNASIYFGITRVGLLNSVILFIDNNEVSVIVPEGQVGHDTTLISYPLTAGTHVIDFDSGVTQSILGSVIADYHIGCSYLLVLNLDGGTAGVDGLASGTSLTLPRNPVRGDATLEYSLSQPGRARLAVYDVAGREVATLFDGDSPAGPGVSRWAASDARPGVYFARLETAGGQALVRRIVVTD